jgi:hypothetical protein
MRPARYDVIIYLSWRHSLYTMSKVLAGLMRAEGIRYRFARAQEMVDPSFSADPHALLVGVFEPSTGRRALACIELWDANNYFARAALDRCDVYFKRSFHPARVSELPSHLRDKVVPFGLNYCCCDARTKGTLVCHRGMRLLPASLRSPLEVVSWAKEDVNPFKQFLLSPAPDAFEIMPDKPAEPVILLQTRLWEPGGTDAAHLERINEERVALVRLLRKEFQDRFIGGLVPTDHAKRAYPELVTSLSTRRSNYASLIGRCLVCIYVRGVHDSIAFKLAEYFAASRCIIAEPLVNEVPAPLVEGVNFLGFSTPEGCLAACLNILEDTVLQRRMRHANHAYYSQHVEPRAHMVNLLVRALCHAPPAYGRGVSGGATQIC